MSARRQSTLLANAQSLLISVLMSLVLLLVLEGLLRLTGLGEVDAAHASRLKYQQIYLPILVPDERADGTPILRTEDSRLPYQSITAEKPANSIRVFTFGGSATAGLGFSPNVTLARHLERMLEQAYPAHSIEVVNLGIVAIAARQVEVLVDHVCKSYEPDAIAVYSGNNEFLEIHAEKYANANANLFTRFRDLLMHTNLYRLVDRAVRGGPKAPSLAEQEFSPEDLRMTQNELIQDIEMDAGEIDQVIASYGETISRIAQKAVDREVPVVLMTVASNWKWRGREDLPPNWLDDFVANDGTPLPSRYEKALELLAQRIDTATSEERSALQFKRAVAAEELGDFDLARREYRAAMNSDPHLRRALDDMAAEVHAVANRDGLPLVDVIEVLRRKAEHGIVGHDEFYDYVHFTPRAAVIVAAATFEAMLESGILPATDFEPAAYARARIAMESDLEQDLLPVKEWLGFGIDGNQTADRDLWKYDRFVKSLDARIEASSDDARALVYRGNAHAWKIGGAGEAAEDYRAAIALPGDHRAAEANLEWLEAEGR